MSGQKYHTRNPRNLTIPLSPFTNVTGMARGRARDAISLPSSFSNRGSIASAQLLFGKRENNGAEPLFKLQCSVAFPTRPFPRPALEELDTKFETSIRSALEALVK
jgi:hypothetical protein